MILVSHAIHEIAHAHYLRCVFGKAARLQCLSRARLDGGVDHYRVMPTDAYLADCEDEAGCLLAGAIGEVLLLGESPTITSLHRHALHAENDFAEVLKFLDNGWVDPLHLNQICTDTARIIRPAVTYERALEYSRLMDIMNAGDQHMIEPF